MFVEDFVTYKTGSKAPAYNILCCAALVGGPEVRFLLLGEPPGGAGEARVTELALPGCAVSSAAWSPDGHLFALATQAQP